MKYKNLFSNDRSESFYRSAVFFICLFASAFVFLPFVIKGNGILTLCLDFDAQELPFNLFVNREIKNGNVFFNWSTDIGSALIPSFSFYNIGSPFFWITLLFKPEYFPYLIVFIYPLKYAVAGLTAYLWLERHVEHKWLAVIGGVLYSFSGFQATNIVFYHFHDAVAFFPLLLLGIDLLMQNNEWKTYVLALFLNASTNWVFFIGEVIFVILYYCIRYRVFSRLFDGEWRAVAGEVLRCVCYALLGVGCAAIIVIPSVFTMLGSSRITDHISLRDGLHFALRDYALIIRGFLFPSEPMNRMSAIVHTNWYSVSTYLPMVSIVPAAAFSLKRRNRELQWVRNLLLVLLIMAVVPFLNSIFSAFNREPYRRWYYMLVLLMVLASLAELELALEFETERKFLSKVTALILTGMTVFMLLMTVVHVNGYDENTIGAVINPVSFAVYYGVGIIGVFVFFALLRFYLSEKKLVLWILIGVIGVGQCNLLMNVIRYRRSNEWKSTEAVVDNVLLTTRDLKNDTIPYRWNICDGTYPFSPYYNMNMAGSLTSRNSFTSTIDNGIFEFYDAIDYHRHTGSPNGPEGTHELLSVRYYLIQEGDNPGDSMAGRDLILQYNNGSRDNSVYEDPEALPIGFTYDSYMTRSEFSGIYRDDRSKAMLRTLVIADEDEPAVSSCMEHISPEKLRSFSTEEMHEDIIDRSRESSIQFEHNSRSFSSIIEADGDKYAFFSVPYSRSWKASVNGQKQDILNVNGLIAVKVNGGTNHIQFEYDLTIYYIALIVTVICWSYVTVCIVKGKKNETKD